MICPLAFRLQTLQTSIYNRQIDNGLISNRLQAQTSQRDRINTSVTTYLIQCRNN